MSERRLPRAYWQLDATIFTDCTSSIGWLLLSFACEPLADAFELEEPAVVLADPLVVVAGEEPVVDELP